MFVMLSRDKAAYNFTCCIYTCIYMCTYHMHVYIQHWLNIDISVVKDNMLHMNSYHSWQMILMYICRCKYIHSYIFIYVHLHTHTFVHVYILPNLCSEYSLLLFISYILFLLLCWGYTVTFATVLKMYQIYHSWIHPLHHHFHSKTEKPMIIHVNQLPSSVIPL
jgi:hypothetical protein